MRHVSWVHTHVEIKIVIIWFIIIKKSLTTERRNQLHMIQMLLCTPRSSKDKDLIFKKIYANSENPSTTPKTQLVKFISQNTLAIQYIRVD